MVMYQYSIVLPFDLNWKYVAPSNFETLEYFVTPTVSLALSKITNGPNNFAIGAYLVGGLDKKRFANEFMPIRSNERIRLAFNKEEVSCFFTEGEAKELELLFAENKFICHKVEVMKNGSSEDLFKLDEDEFEEVMKVFGKLGVHQIMDVANEQETFETLRSDMYNEAYTKAKKEFNQYQMESRHMTTRKLKRMAMAGTALLAIAVGLRYVSKALMGKGVFGTIAGIGTYVLSMISGIGGFKLMNSVAENYDEGVIFA
jgi:hypothetical protein